MKTALLIMLLFFSFLAVCRAEVDEFELFEKAPATGSPDKGQGKSSKKSAGPTPQATPTPSKTTPAPTATPPVPALSRLEKIEKLKADIRKDPKKIHLIQQLAEEFYALDDTEKVTALLWKYIDKIDRNGIILLAQAHEKRKEPEPMIKALNLQIAKDSKDYEAFYLLGNAYGLKAKNKETVENYKNSIELNPKFESPYFGLVKYYEKYKNLYELRMLYQDMVESIGPRAPYLSKLCDVNTRDGTFEAAIIQCKEALVKNPDDVDSQVNLGLSYKGTGDLVSAEKNLKLAATRFPQSEFAQYSYGKSLEEQKNYLEALTFYKAAAAADDKSSRAWLGTATAAFELQKFEAALNSFKKACTLDRTMRTAFRKAAAQLNIMKNDEWSRKFATALEVCSYGS